MTMGTTVPRVAEIRDLRVGFGSKTVLDGIDLEIPERQTIAIMGPVRAGKSTLLKALAGRPLKAEQWRKGNVRVEVRGSLVEQGHPQGDHSLGEILGLSGSSLADELLVAWGPDFEDAIVKVLDTSTVAFGELPLEAARLSVLTIALASKSPLLLLDEPDANLCEQARSWVIGRLEQLRGQRTLILATHHLGLARRASDHSYLLVDGQMIEWGPTESFFENPRHERTQYYVRMGG